MKGYCPGWASKALRPSFKNNTPVDVLTPSWCLGPSFENQEPARGSCAKTAQAAASPWFGEGSAADYWGTAGEPFLLSACSPNPASFHFQSHSMKSSPILLECLMHSRHSLEAWSLFMLQVPAQIHRLWHTSLEQTWGHFYTGRSVGPLTSLLTAPVPFRLF